MFLFIIGHILIHYLLQFEILSNILIKQKLIMMCRIIIYADTHLGNQHYTNN